MSYVSNSAVLLGDDKLIRPVPIADGDDADQLRQRGDDSKSNSKIVEPTENAIEDDDEVQIEGPQLGQARGGKAKI